MSKRKSNWSSEELQLLIDSCSTSTVISAKLSASVTAAHKDTFCEECTERVNSAGVNGNRTKEEVKKKWTDTKVVSFLPVSVIDGIMEDGDLFQETLDIANSSANHCATNKENDERTEPLVPTKEKGHSAYKKRKHTDTDDYSKILDQGEENIKLKRWALDIKQAQNDILKEMLEQQKITNNILIRILESPPKPVQSVSPVIKFSL